MTQQPTGLQTGLWRLTVLLLLLLVMVVVV